MTLQFDHRLIAEILEPLAVQAGEEILIVRAKGVSASSKTDLSPVTEADQRAEAVILSGLKVAFPHIPIVAEEEAAAGRIPDVAGKAFFLVDPLDGTKEFIKGGTDFTVNIALIENGVPVAGVVFAPASGVLYSGGPQGAFRVEVLGGERLAGRQRLKGAKPQPTVRIVASKSHNTPETDAFIARFADVERISIGSSLKFCLLAEGTADIYPRYGRTMEWDTAAGDAVLRAAGGKTLFLDGRPFAYGKQAQGTDSDFANPHFIAVTGQAAPLLSGI